VAAPLILQPYERRRPPGPLRKLVAGMGLVFLAAFYGLLCTILPMQMIIVPLVPILVLMALTLWLLPDTGGVQYDTIAKGMLWFIGLNAMWPNYVAINAPGLPIITPTRIALFATLVIIAFNFSTSHEMRSQVIKANNSLPLVRRMFWLFWLTTVVALPFSDNLFFSLTKFANNQVYWTIPFVITAWLASREGFTLRVGQILTIAVLVVAALSLPEVRTQTPIWIPHMPSFLRIDPALLEQLSTGNARAGTGAYRLRGIFTGALYYAEYLSVMFPFVVHALCRQRSLPGFLLLAAGVIMMGVVMYLTGSRSAMLALLLTPLTYTLLVAWRVRLQNPSSIAASLGVFSYPLAAISLALTVVFWRRLHVLVIGGGQHASSTDARETQWAMGWPKIGSRPFGHGAGRSGDTLGYFNPGSDTPTVDSFYLTTLLDYGVLGLVFFLALFATMLWYGFRLHNRARSEEQLMMGPILVSLFNFIVIKSVASTESNLPFIFIMMGCVFGLASRQAQIDEAEAAKLPVVAPVLRPSGRRSPALA
jgi:hypothetical protein